MAALGLSSAAHAQELAPPEGESAVVQELEVVARPPGPALWRVRRGESEVVILGGLTPLPHSLEWSSPRLDRAMKEARLVLLPPKASASPLEAARLLLRYPSLRTKNLRGGLPPELRARVERTAASIGKDPKTYDSWKPGVAGFMMLEHFREQGGLSSAKPGSTLARRAKAAGVTAKPIEDFKASSLMKAAANLPPQTNIACLTAALDEIDHEAANAPQAARAWATGDLAGVRARAAPALLDACLQQVPTFGVLLERGTAEAVSDIEKALAKPGRTIAVIDLQYLLRRDGVLDRLRARGAVVDLPPE